MYNQDTFIQKDTVMPYDKARDSHSSAGASHSPATQYQAVQDMVPTRELVDYLIDNFKLRPADAVIHAEAVTECITHAQPRSK